MPLAAGLPADLTIHPVRPGDRDTVAAVVAAAFASPAHARLVDELRASDAHHPALDLVATLNGEVVGHVMVTDAELHDGPTVHRVLNLSPLAVAPAHQGRGIGAALVRAVVAAADTAGEALIVLEGDPRYYPRFGFRPAGPLGIEIDLPGWAPPEAAQALPLAAYDPVLRGRVTYPEPFARVGHEG